MTTTNMLRPTDLRSLRDAVRDSTGTLAIAGAGTAADWAGTLDSADAVLDTTALTGVITHNPADMTVSVQAGTPLRVLQEELLEHGQHVAFDAARAAEGATIGGLFATGDSGPAALVHGSLRDLVIGVTVVLADGTVARSGGHVIKNVAGYDLAKLLHGSCGTLGVLAEVVLRLHPLPQRTATLVIGCDFGSAIDHAATVLGGPYEPAACEWTSDDTLLIRMDGTADALAGRVENLRTVLGPLDYRDEPYPWVRHQELTRGEQAVLRIGVKPARLPEVLDALPCASVTAGLGTGIATVSLPPEAVAEAHERVHAVGGTSALRSRPAGADLPAWGPPPSAIGVLRALKAELDPKGRFGPGRFNPWM